MSTATLTRIEAVQLTEAEEDLSDLDPDQSKSDVLEYTDSEDEETTRSEIEDRHSTTSSSIASISQNDLLALKYLEFQKKKVCKDKTPSTIVNFFTNLGETVSTFPVNIQSKVKADVFRIVNEEETVIANQGNQFENQLVIPKNKWNLIKESSTVITHPLVNNGVMKTSSSMASISSDGTQVSMSYNVSTGNEILIAPKYCQFT